MSLSPDGTPRRRISKSTVNHHLRGGTKTMPYDQLPTTTTAPVLDDDGGGEHHSSIANSGNGGDRPSHEFVEVSIDEEEKGDAAVSGGQHRASTSSSCNVKTVEEEEHCKTGDGTTRRRQHSMTTGGLAAPDESALFAGEKYHDEEGDDDDFDTDASSSATATMVRPPRSIDDYLEDAYASSSTWGMVRYGFMIMTLGVANLGDAAELSGVGYLLSNEQFQNEILHNDMKTNGSIVASISLLGMIVGGTVVGAFEDTLGRKPTLIMGLVINSISCFASAFTSQVSTMAFFRFIAGLGIGAISSSLNSLTAELSPPSHRGLLVTIVSGFWAFGMLFVAFCAWFFMGLHGYSWRVYLAMTVVPTVCSIVLVSCLVPESGRFLALHGHYIRAARQTNWIGEELGYRGEELHVDEIRHHFLGEGQQRRRRSSVASPRTTWAAVHAATDNLAVLFSKDLRGTTIVLIVLWVCLEMGGGLGSFINVIFKEEHANPYIGTFLAAIGTTLGCVAGALLLDKVGRKPMVFWSLLFASFTMFTFSYIVHTEAKPSVGMIAAVVAYSTLLNVTWSANIVMTTELYPTKCRNTAFGFIAAAGRTGNIVEQFINGALVGTPDVLVAVGGCILLVGTVTMCVMKAEDMTGQSLADNVVDGGDDTSRNAHKVQEKEYAMVSIGNTNGFDGGGGNVVATEGEIV